VSESFQVAVFPVAADRWIAVIKAPGGPFSTEVAIPEDVEREVSSAITEVLGTATADFQLVDDLGGRWTVEASDEQRRRLAL